jgi:hypothetical protein
MKRALLRLLKSKRTIMFSRLHWVTLSSRMAQIA